MIPILQVEAALIRQFKDEYGIYEPLDDSLLLEFNLSKIIKDTDNDGLNRY